MDIIKDAESYLEGYWDLKDSITTIAKEIELLDEDIKSVKSLDYSGMPHGSGAAHPDDRLVNLLYKKQVKESLLERTKAKVAFIDDILTKLSKDEDGKVLKAYYIDVLRKEELERVIGSCERNIYRMKNKALRRFAIQLFGIVALGN